MNMLEQRLREIADRDLEELRVKDAEYNSSWKKRGGTGAFHQGIARKWDRLEELVKRFNYDLFAAIRNNMDPKSPLRDSIGDLRRYLALIDAEVMAWSSIDSTDGMDSPFGYDPEDP